MCYVLYIYFFFFNTAVNKQGWIFLSRETARFCSLFPDKVKQRVSCMIETYQSACLVLWWDEKWKVIGEFGWGGASLLPGPQLPYRGLFQYPANMDGGSGTFCTPVLNTQGGLPMGFWHDPTRVRSQAAAMRGSTTSRAPEQWLIHRRKLCGCVAPQSWFHETHSGLTKQACKISPLMDA